MFETLKKKSAKTAQNSSILLFIIGIIIMVFTAKHAFSGIFGYKDFTELRPEEIKKGQIVEVDLYATIGCYAELYETSSGSSYKKTTDLYYAIFTGDENEEDYRIMSVKVPASLEKQMEKLCDEFMENGISDDTVYLCGTIKELNEKEYSYFEDVIDVVGEENTLPYYIDCYVGKQAVDVAFIIGFLCGVALLVWGVLRLVKGRNGGFLKNFLKDIANAGFSEAAIDSDYNHAISFDKKESKHLKSDSVKVGRLMTYYSSGSAPRAIPNNKIMWAYQNTTTHRTNGIKTGTTYSLIIIVEKVANAYQLPVPNEATAQNILSTMNQMFPWVITGYSEQLQNLLRNNRDQFVALRYNTCEHIAVEPGMEAFINSSNTTEN